MAQTIGTEKEIGEKHDSLVVQKVKRAAKKMSKAHMVSHSFALDQLSRKEGYKNYRDLLKANPPRQVPVVPERKGTLAEPRYSDKTRRDGASPEPRRTIPIIYKKRRKIDLRNVPNQMPGGSELSYEAGKEEDETLGAQMPFHGDQD